MRTHEIKAEHSQSPLQHAGHEISRTASPAMLALVGDLEYQQSRAAQARALETMHDSGVVLGYN